MLRSGTKPGSGALDWMEPPPSMSRKNCTLPVFGRAGISVRVRMMEALSPAFSISLRIRSRTRIEPSNISSRSSRSSSESPPAGMITTLTPPSMSLGAMKFAIGQCCASSLSLVRPLCSQMSRCPSTITKSCGPLVVAAWDRRDADANRLAPSNEPLCEKKFLRLMLLSINPSVPAGLKLKSHPQRELHVPREILLDNGHRPEQRACQAGRWSLIYRCVGYIERLAAELHHHALSEPRLLEERHIDCGLPGIANIGEIARRGAELVRCQLEPRDGRIRGRAAGACSVGQQCTRVEPLIVSQPSVRQLRVPERDGVGHRRRRAVHVIHDQVVLPVARHQV